VTIVCPYCRNEILGTVEREHVFPDSWYPEGTDPRIERSTVPSCSGCNRSYGKIEERLLRAWGLCLPDNAEASRGIPARVLRSLDQAAARNPRDADFRKKTRLAVQSRIDHYGHDEIGAFPGLEADSYAWGKKRSGVVVRGAPALTVDARDISAFTEKLVRGMHFVFTDGQILPADVAVSTFVVRQEVWPQLESMVHNWSMSAALSVPPGLVVYTKMAIDDSRGSIWIFLIWNTICLQGATLPP
jgi:hypothetical protein